MTGQYEKPRAAKFLLFLLVLENYYTSYCCTILDIGRSGIVHLTLIAINVPIMNRTHYLVTLLLSGILFSHRQWALCLNRTFSATRASRYWTKSKTLAASFRKSISCLVLSIRHSWHWHICKRMGEKAQKANVEWCLCWYLILRERESNWYTITLSHERQ
jgi:hypothetical protein